MVSFLTKANAVVTLMLMLVAASASDLLAQDAAGLATAVDFTTDVLPILQSKCIACHNSTNSESDLVLETAAQLIKGGSSGAGIIPGKPDDSLIYQLAARTEEPEMPPLPNDVKAAAVSPAELGVLRNWILQGAQASAATKKAIAWKAINPRLRAVYSVAYDDSIGLIAASRANAIELYDLHRRRSIGSLVDPEEANGTLAHRDVVQSLAFHPNGKMLASGGYRVVKLWTRTVSLVKEIRTDHAITRFAVAEDGRIAIGCADGSLSVHTDSTDTAPLRLVGHKHAVKAIAFAAAGSLITADESGEVRVWKTAAAQSTVAAAAALNAKPLSVMQTGKHVAVGIADGRLLVLEVADLAKVPVELKGHAGAISAIVAGPQPHLVFSGGVDGTVQKWDLNAKKQLLQLKADGPIVAMAASPDLNRFAAVTESGKSFVWNSANGKQLCVCDRDHKLAYDKASTQRVQKAHDRRLNYRTGLVNAAKTEVETQRKSVKTAAEKLTKAKTAADAAKKKFAAHEAKLAAAQKLAAEKPNDAAAKKQLATIVAAQPAESAALAKAQKAVRAAEQDVDITNKSLDRAGKTHAAEEAARKKLEGDKARIASELKRLSDSPTNLAAGLAVYFDTNDCLVTFHEDGSQRSWNSTTGVPLNTVMAATKATAARSNGSLSLVQTADNTIAPVLTRWSLAATLGDDAAFPGRIMALDFNADGSLLAVGTGQSSRDGEIQLWDVATTSLKHAFRNAHSDTVLDVEFSPDGTQLLSCGADKFARIWNVADASPVRSFEGHTHHVLAASWQPDMTRIATAGGDNFVKVWDVDTGQQKRTIRSHRKHVTGLQYVGSTDTILTCSGDRTVRTSNANDGRNLRTMQGSSDYLHAVAGARDESIVVSGGDDGSVRVWNAKDGKILATFEPSRSRTR